VRQFSSRRFPLSVSHCSRSHAATNRYFDLPPRLPVHLAIRTPFITFRGIRIFGVRGSILLQLHNQLLGVIGPSTEFARCALQMYRIARRDLIHVLLCQGELLFASSLPVHSSFRVASDTTALTIAGAGRVDCTRTDRDRPELHYADISALKVERISESMISSHGRYSAAEISAKLPR
jgi:hypothetical protein